jgi:predicted enzyme related to lactoylglutathione lyase
MLDSVAGMSDTPTLRGMATANYWAADWGAARRWYTELIGASPTLSGTGMPSGGSATGRPRRGLVDARYRPPGAAADLGGAVLYWHVADLPGMVQRLLAMGATAHEPVQDRDHGFVTATVVDPFGNLLGVMHNPRY